MRVSTAAHGLIEAACTGRTPSEVGRALFIALGQFGVRALFSRSYRGGCFESESVLARISPPGWESLYAERRFQNVNYLMREIPRRGEPFLWSEIKLISPGEVELSRALADWGVPDGIAAPVHSAGGYVGTTSLAFEKIQDVDEPDRVAIGIAATVAHSRMQTLANPRGDGAFDLSPRERDCLGFVAQGRSDWEISDILCVAESTVITHVQNARRKLGAKTRSQAVAICVAAGII